DKKAFLHRISVNYLQEIEDNEEAFFITGIKREIDYIDLMAELEKEHIERPEKKPMNKATNNSGEIEQVKKFPFSRGTIVIAYLFWQVMKLRDKDDNILFDASASDFARFVCNNFCNKDGSSFSVHSIRSYFNDFKNGKPPAKKSRIDISGIELLED
ncbi:MAG: hypothetical protein AB8F74_11255, partial [Saprospiraceae bacterium]